MRVRVPLRLCFRKNEMTRKAIYPFECPACGEVSVYPKSISYAAKFKINGMMHEFTIANVPIEECTICEEQLFSSNADNAIQAALHQHLEEQNAS